MDVGLMMIFSSYGWDEVSDDQVWEEDVKLALQAPALGFNALWSAEHHFFDYSFCPDNLQLMTYLTAKCPDIDVGTAAVIVPWHDPLRVAEQAAMLDHLSNGRLRLGLGRGLARREFAAFRGTMNESRERFDEAAPMIVEALRTGWIEGDGKHYKQPRVEIRPRPSRSFEGRIYAVASSEDSVMSCAKLGAHMVMFSDRPWPMRLPAIEQNRKAPARVSRQAGALDDDHRLRAVRAEQTMSPRNARANTWANSWRATSTTTSCSVSTSSRSRAMMRMRKRPRSRARAASRARSTASCKPPPGVRRTACCARIEKRRELIGDYEINASFRFGGIPFDTAQESLSLFAKEVLPVLKSWQNQQAPAQAAE